jgi:transposase
MVLEGIAWRFRTGTPWRDVPERSGSWNTLHQRHTAGRTTEGTGGCTSICCVKQTAWVSSIGWSRLTRRSWVHTSTPLALAGRTCWPLLSTLQRQGPALSMVVTAGNINDTTMLEPVLDAIVVPHNGRSGRPRKRPDPEPKDQKANRAWRGSQGGRPVGFDGETYTHRNTVERLEQWRGLAMRTDKHAHNDDARLLLAAMVMLTPTDPRDRP